MLQFLKICAVTVLMFGIAPPSASAQAEDIQATIDQQLEAFQADDFERAFGYASPMLRRLFGTSDNFRSMVTGGYPMVWRPAEVRYLELAEIGGTYLQKVLIKDQSGVVHILAYRMIETPEGWKISGVQIIPAPDVGA